ncbi:MAG: TonB-dependent receptor plug domain-containing protein [Paracoccus aminovorans]|nr:TonB-dependent receptor plug domain-containing protein [Paracoccus aminovorans]
MLSDLFIRRRESLLARLTRIVRNPQTAEDLAQDAYLRVSHALETRPVAHLDAGTNGGQSERFDAYFVRGSGGCSAAANTADTMDGLRWRIPGRSGVQFDPWMVEVVKGPASALFGAGSPGSIVNLVSKRPAFQRGDEC